MDDDTTAKNLNPLTYRGYVYDSETGLYYLQSRYYDPVVGRFINGDDPGYLGSGGLTSFNLFVYCGNNPVMRCDHGGTCWHNGDWFKLCDVCKENLQAAYDTVVYLGHCVEEYVYEKAEEAAEWVDEKIYDIQCEIEYQVECAEDLYDQYIGDIDWETIVNNAATNAIIAGIEGLSVYLIVAAVTAPETGGVSLPVAAVTWAASTVVGFVGEVARGYIDELKEDD